MNFIFRASGLLGLLVMPAITTGAEPAPPANRWALGAGAALIDSPYAGEGDRLRPFPLVNYEGERFFLRGISGGVHLRESEAFSLDAQLSARLDGFDIDDLGSAELLANGVDADLLGNRDDGLDLGLRVVRRSRFGTVSLEGSHDITSASNGAEVSFDYSYSWQLRGTTLTASAGSSWMSADLARYYYGILDEEVARGVTEYAPGSVVTIRMGVTVMRPLGSHWRLLLSGEYVRLPDDLRESPLLESDARGTGRVVLGILRSF